MTACLCGLACVLGARAGTPVTFETLDPIRPDETLLLFGADVTPRATAEGMRVSDDPVESPPGAGPLAEPAGKPQALEMLQATDLSAKILIPGSWKPGIYAVRLRNANGFGPWQFANRPQIWWQISGAGGYANPGGRIRVFGKNFGPKSRLWLVNAAGKTRELGVEAAHDFDVTAGIPAGLPTGEYRLWLHNGCGGMAGFGEPIAVRVAQTEKWPTAMFNVRDFGARGDNQTDDTSAIRRALEWAGGHGGGVVYLPRGTYLVTGKLVIPPHTVLRGEGKEMVWLKVPFYWPAQPKLLPEFDAVIAGNGQFAVEDLSIIAQPVQRLVVAPDAPDMCTLGLARVAASTPLAPNIRLSNLGLWHLYYAHRVAQDSAAPTSIAVNGADFTLENCEVVSPGMPIQVSNATRAVIKNNVLRIGRGWYGLWNFHDGIFEGNDISSGDLTGSYGGIQWSASHVMFDHNHWHDSYGGEREALSFDSPYSPIWMGHITMKGARLELGRQEGGGMNFAQTPPENLMAIVTGGQGVGQCMPVLALSSKEVTLEKPFAVAPDSTSLVVLDARKSQVLVVDNLFEDASVAIQLYAQSHEFIIAGNQCVRTGGSYALASDFSDGDPSRRRYSCALFNQWLDNTFDQGLVYSQGIWPYGYVGYATQRLGGARSSTPAIGNRFEHNRLNDGTRMGAENYENIPSEDLAPDAIPMARDAIFEKNHIGYQPVGISVNRGHWFTLLRKNRTPNVEHPAQNQGSETVILP
ncbi:MAG TPA: glycosyl hydrolase family 28-related protein [Chthoniobacterales bacterium]